MNRMALMFVAVAAGAPGAHAAEFSGLGDIYLGGAYIGETTVWSIGGAGRLNASLDERWNAEGEAFLDRLFNQDGSLAAFGGAGHLYWRDPQVFALGGFVAGNGLWGNGTHFATHYRVGPQAQIYGENATLYGQAWFGQEFSVGNPTPLDEVGVRAMLRWFPTENVRLDGELTYLAVNGAGIEASGIIAALQANYRFSDAGWTVFGRYQLDHPMGDATFVGDLHRIHFGLRYSFGTGSLKDEDRNGATMEAPTRIIHFFARS